MIKESFPFNYFSVWLSPTKMFQKRHDLRWFQIVIILLFLLALNILPVPFFYQKQQSMPLDLYLPHVQKLLQKNSSQLQQASQAGKFADGRYHFGHAQVLQEDKQGVVGVNLSEKQLAHTKNAVVLGQRSFIFKENGTVNRLYYGDSFRADQPLKKQLNQEWYHRNKAAISFAMLQSIGSLFLLTNLVFVFGGGLILWLGRKSPLITLESLRESVTVMVNILGPVSLVVAIVGLVKFDVSLLLTLQMLGAVMLLLTIYAKTRFNDGNLS
ncbi:MAG TPA: hypothetical protein H9869_07545 [Candidatus Ligilactobacillus excrementipullorum]|nr:hypothetical protein [Candidatus Ligilactobacillus excrementipullorum]